MDWKYAKSFHKTRDLHIIENLVECKRLWSNQTLISFTVQYAKVKYWVKELKMINKIRLQQDIAHLFEVEDFQRKLRQKRLKY